MLNILAKGVQVNIQYLFKNNGLKFKSKIFKIKKTVQN